jgi:hypothetical protein
MFLVNRVDNNFVFASESSWNGLQEPSVRNALKTVLTNAIRDLIVWGETFWVPWFNHTHPPGRLDGHHMYFTVLARHGVQVPNGITLPHVGFKVYVEGFIQDMLLPSAGGQPPMLI